MGRKKLSKEEVEARFGSVGLRLLEEYQNSYTPLLTKCRVCKYTWESYPSNVFKGQGCPECSNRNKSLTQSEVAARLLKVHLVLLDEYKNQQTEVLVKCQLCSREFQIRIIGDPSRKGRQLKCGCLVSSSEETTREIFERLTGWKFPRARPDWLKGRGDRSLELDGYNKRNAVAFEYQGEQHYEPNFGEDTLFSTKRNDNRKRCLARYHGVTLIRVPYWKQDSEVFIKMKLGKAGIL